MLDRHELLYLGACILAAPGKLTLMEAAQAAEDLMVATGETPARRNSATPESSGVPFHFTDPAVAKHLDDFKKDCHTNQLRAAEEAAVRQAVASCAGNVTKAAARLGIKRTTLCAKLRRMRLRKQTGDAYL